MKFLKTKDEIFKYIIGNLHGGIISPIHFIFYLTKFLDKLNLLLEIKN